MDIGIEIFEKRLNQINHDFYHLIYKFIEYNPVCVNRHSGNHKLYKNKKFYYSTMVDLKFYGDKPLIANSFTFKSLFHDIGHAIFFAIEDPNRLLLDNFGLNEKHAKNAYEEVNAILISEQIFLMFKDLECYYPTERLRIFKNNKNEINKRFENLNILKELERLNHALLK